jgi:prepilin-type N-terminal cleavage/methylation domain-containing protein
MLMKVLDFRGGRSQRGDTLVEVMIAMAIMSLVLAGAYVTSMRNSAAMHSAQEREQGQRLVEGQIEMLRANGGIAASGNCFSGGTETSVCNNFSASNSGATYTLSITMPVGPNPIYTVKAVWTSVGSKTANDSNVTMFYRIN